MATSKRVKGVEETEAIRVYVTRDPSPRCEDGAMWSIESPISVKARFEKKYPDGCWAKNRKELAEAIAEITQWKLEVRKEKPVSKALA